MTTFTVSTTDYTLDANGAPDRITTIHWRATKTEGEMTSSSYGTYTPSETVGEETIAGIPVATTEAELITLLETEIGADVTARLDAQLDRQNNPTQASGRVWEIPAGTKVWQANTSYAVDDVALDPLNGMIPYTCLQAHDSQRGWNPSTTPALWSIQNQGGGGPQEWVPNEQVDVGYQRTYNGTTYEVLQAHTTQAGWEPPNVPALWKVVV